MNKFFLVIRLFFITTNSCIALSTTSSIYDVAILGSGPAGLTAGAYAARAQLKTIIIEGPLPGGLLMKTGSVENWPGEVSILGPDLMCKMSDIAKHYGCTLLEATVSKINFKTYPFTLTTQAGTEIKTKSIIIATGAALKKLNCPGEEEYFGKGIAACATCDAPFYKDQEVIVVGTGNPAIAEVEHLTHYAKKITVIERSDKVKAHDQIKTKILNHPNVSILFNSVIKEIKGDGENVTSVSVENLTTNTVSTLKADGIFVAIGFTPNTELFKGSVDLLPSGHIKLEKNSHTNIKGVFAAGNVVDAQYQQAITCAGMGCMAALDAQRFLTGTELTYQDISRHWRSQDTLNRMKKTSS